jgi:hypothetical protein
MPKSFFKKIIKKLCSQIENFIKSNETLIFNYAVKRGFFQKS